MSRKTTKSIISRDEISLLLNSEEPKDTKLYGNLYSVLSNLQNLKAVSLDQLSDIDNKAKASLTYNKKTLIDTVIKEWYAESVSEEDSSKKVRCGLCNTPNKYLYYIRNRRNNMLLNVGSYCITKFPGIDGYIEQKEQLNQIHKGHQIINRRNEFYDKFPECEKYISEAEIYFNSLPILLPYELYTKLNDIIVRMRLIYTKYVNEGKKPYESIYDSFQLYQLTVDQYEKTKTESDIFVSANKEAPLVCQRSEINWMVSHNKFKLLNEISENNGRYTVKTLQKIWSIEYLQKHIDNIFSKNQSEFFEFKRFNGESIVLLLNKFGYDPSISFVSNISDFMIEIGAKCIVDNTFSFGNVEILKASTIRNTKSNLISILTYIEGMVDKMNYVFILDESTNALLLIRKGDKALRYFKPHEFMIAFSKRILCSDEKLKLFLYSLCHGSDNSKWVTRELQEKQGIDEKITKLYKDYKERHDQYYWS